MWMREIPDTSGGTASVYCLTVLRESIVRVPGPVPDRRQRRLPEPPCPDCGSEVTCVTVRTSMVVYWRCRACGAMWSVPKPRAEPDTAA
jgi:predicted RNA-binding Zn-ribbon protein involved in translation (DUF1610 family)